MEFETNKATTTDDIVRADTPRVTLQPLHADVAPDAVDAPGLVDSQIETVFEFEAESTASAALSSPKLSDHPHHNTAIMFAALIAFVFGGTLLAVYMIR